MRSSICVVSIALSLAACGSSGSETKVGDACDANTPCGDGQVCDLTDPKGAACVDANGDEDNDGIPNSMDKCQHMAGGLYDEDGDGIGDECDRCPIAKPPATPDTDNDGVDSPCDPNPTSDGEKIVLFSGFNGNALPDGWTPSTAGVWTVTGGEAIMTPPNDTQQVLAAPLALSTTHTVVMSAYRVDQVTSTVEADAAVGAASHLPMGDTVVTCGGRRTCAADNLSVTNGVPQPFNNLFDSAGLYTMAIQLEGANANCALIANTEKGAVQGGISAFRPNQAILSAQGAKVRFEYLLVVQKP